MVNRSVYGRPQWKEPDTDIFTNPIGSTEFKHKTNTSSLNTNPWLGKGGHCAGRKML